jgi:heterotetrameric sarcosine oxidase gamma subunit
VWWLRISMIRAGRGIVTEVTISIRPAAPLHIFEIWSAPAAVAARFEAVTGFALPPLGRSAGNDALRLIRYEPTVWLVEGDPAPMAMIPGDDGAITAIGGGVACVRLSGPGWRTLLMEGGVFDAENPGFAIGCSAATIINHVAVRLHVLSPDACDIYVPASLRAALIQFWHDASLIQVDG